MEFKRPQNFFGEDIPLTVFISEEQLRNKECVKLFVKYFEDTGIFNVFPTEIANRGEYLGDVLGNINARRGRVEGTEQRGNSQTIRGIVPLSEMFGYATDLRSRTQGRVNYTMQFSHYEQVPNSIAEKITGKK